MTAPPECEPSALTPNGAFTAEAIRNAVRAIIDADLTYTETLTAVWSLIPKEYHVTHHR